MSKTKVQVALDEIEALAKRLEGHASEMKSGATSLAGDLLRARAGGMRDAADIVRGMTQPRRRTRR